MTWIKICGVTRVADAERAVQLGASALGLNFVPSSKRRVTHERARSIADAVRGRVEVVAVVANPTDLEVKTLRGDLGIEWLQLHGDEPSARVSDLLPHAFKAMPIGNAADVRSAATIPGQRLLVDTKVGGVSGGTGQVFDWRLVVDLAAQRQLIVAGGLTPQNVASAVRALSPFGVDVASGVEKAPGIKDDELLAAFMHAVQSAR